MNFTDDLARLTVKFLGLSFGKMGNWPRLSQQSFKMLADFCYDEVFKQSDIELLYSAKVIHVRSHLLESFLELHGSNISASVLITGDSDFNFIHYFEIPFVVKLWLCQNLKSPQDKTQVPIPIGLEDAKFGRLGLKLHYYFRGKKKVPKIYIPPMSITNTVRDNFELPLNSNLYVREKTYLNAFRYSMTVRKYQFVLCLEGNGFDNHRIWESLYFRSFPVMLKSEFSISLKSLGLPILIVDSLRDITLEVLRFHVKQNSDFNPKDCGLLWMPYWKEMVETCIRSN